MKYFRRNIVCTANNIIETLIWFDKIGETKVNNLHGSIFFSFGKKKVLRLQITMHNTLKMTKGYNI
nr:hypothetical protein Iba_chr11bCG4430 [Ipomoea batatas]GMD55074.1 hypothetical protein Iba_chr11dCG4430 [Ipomoea batatas]GMD56638.1 hypothetical protein Iba_chr11eCG5090 [Ipomoea batatas]GMD58541.1 hypothetical protein Iba_chr11fCG6550 [Ipomoea batatas]